MRFVVFNMHAESIDKESTGWTKMRFEHVPLLRPDTSRKVILEGLAGMIKELHTSKSVEKLVLEASVSFGKHRTRIWKGRVHEEPKKTIMFDSMSPSNKIR